MILMKYEQYKCTLQNLNTISGTFDIKLNYSLSNNEGEYISFQASFFFPLVFITLIVGKVGVFFLITKSKFVNSCITEMIRCDRINSKETIILIKY